MLFRYEKFPPVFYPRIVTYIVVATIAGFMRRIYRYGYRLGPAELVLLDRDESALHGIQLDLYNQGLFESRHSPLRHSRPRGFARYFQRAPPASGSPYRRIEASVNAGELPAIRLEDQHFRFVEPIGVVRRVPGGSLDQYLY